MKERTKRDLYLFIVISSIWFAILMAYGYERDKPKEYPELIISLPVEPKFPGLDPQEGLRMALEYYNIKHPEIVYAQAVLETGNFKSNLCVNHNNLFGLYNSRKKEYYRFNHWVESVIFYKYHIQNRYKDPEDYYSFLKRIRYAESPTYTDKLKTIVNNDKRRTQTRD